METAEVEKTFAIYGFSNIQAGIVKWPMSVIRLSSSNSDELVNACDLVLRNNFTTEDRPLENIKGEM